MVLPVYLSEDERPLLRSVIVFLEKRLTEVDTLEWALNLGPAQRIERLAVREVLNWRRNINPEVPWGQAWRLIEESWSSEQATGHGEVFSVRERLKGGDRSGAVIQSIVRLVQPRLKVEPVDTWRWQFTKKPTRPRTVDHLLSTSLTSGDLLDLEALKITELSDASFLSALARALEAAVNYGLDIGRRIGWDAKRSFWRIGSLSRVYYTQAKRSGEAFEVDAHHRGIAPSVKLLHTVVTRIADLDQEAAKGFVSRWRITSSPIYARLWAAMARNRSLVEAQEVGDFLRERDDQQFWDLEAFPEISELRAIRFEELPHSVQMVVIRRIRRGPPRSFWPRAIEPDKLIGARLYWTIRELRRIAAAGGRLSKSVNTWMHDHLSQFPDLASIDVNEGFPESPKVRAVPPNPDDRFNSIDGLARLQALEAALSLPRAGWENPAERASDWISAANNVELVLEDFEKSGSADSFPRVWDRFGWAHRPALTNQAPTPALEDAANRVLRLVQSLSDNTLKAAIAGLSAWLDSWGTQVVASAMGWNVWLRIWPFAVQATNAQEDEEEVEPSVSERPADNDDEPIERDTLNTPAGRLVGVFLQGCPTLHATENPFSRETALAHVREVAVNANGRSGLIAKHRMIEWLPYFLRADKDWAHRHLITPLLSGDGTSLALWRAIARRTHFTDVLTIIGPAMQEKAADQRLGRDTRRMLVFSIVVESLHAFREARSPAVPNSRTQQMLRSIDDETRAAAANAVHQFVQELSRKGSDNNEAPSAADLFRDAAAPFLQQVWPQERSLATPGVSKAFADLPAASKDAFAEAVDAIERFLAPFDCWSMVDYGLYGDEGNDANRRPKLELIDDKSKARAFLKLLDLTIGTTEVAVIPHDLSDALDQVQSLDPALGERPEFVRLATAARR